MGRWDFDFCVCIFCFLISFWVAEEEREILSLLLKQYRSFEFGVGFVHSFIFEVENQLGFRFQKQ